MPPRMSAVLNNCLLHCSLPAIAEHITSITKNNAEPSEGFTLLKDTFCEFYGIEKSDFTWDSFKKLMEKSQPYDLQVIMGPVLRSFMSKKGATPELTEIGGQETDYTGRYRPLLAQEGAQYLYGPLGLTLLQDSIDDGNNVIPIIYTEGENQFTPTPTSSFVSLVHVSLKDRHFELDLKYFSTDNSSHQTDMQEITTAIENGSTKEKALAGIEALKQHVKQTFIPSLNSQAASSTPIPPLPSSSTPQTNPVKLHLLEGNITQETLEALAKDNNIPKNKLVFLFPGNLTHHDTNGHAKRGLFGIKGEGGAGLAIPSLAWGKDNNPTLSIPTTGMPPYTDKASAAKDPKVIAAFEDIYAAIGAGYHLVLPVRNPMKVVNDSDNYYFSKEGKPTEHDDQLKKGTKTVEPSFWGDNQKTANTGLASIYMGKIITLKRFIELAEKKSKNKPFSPEDTAFILKFEKKHPNLLKAYNDGRNGTHNILPPTSAASPTPPPLPTKSASSSVPMSGGAKKIADKLQRNHKKSLKIEKDSSGGGFSFTINNDDENKNVSGKIKTDGSGEVTVGQAYWKTKEPSKSSAESFADHILNDLGWDHIDFAKTGPNAIPEEERTKIIAELKTRLPAMKISIGGSSIEPKKAPPVTPATAALMTKDVFVGKVKESAAKSINECIDALKDTASSHKLDDTKLKKLITKKINN